MNEIDPNKQSVEPASTEDVRGLARVGKIASNQRATPNMPHDSAGAPSMSTAVTSWPFPPKNTFLGDLVGRWLGFIARLLSPTFVERSLTFARDNGQYAVLVGSALTLLYAIFAAIKSNSFAVFATGLGFIAALAVAQFAATRFLAAAVQTIAATPSRLASSAFLECAGLLIILFAAAALIGGIVTSIQVGSVIPLVPALVMSAALTYFGAVALHPELVNVEPGDGTAGEEAIGLMSFLFKAGLKLVPLFFCLLAVGGGLAIIASFFQSGQAFASVIGSVLQMLPLPANVSSGLNQVSGGLTGSAVVLLACLLPITAYFVFLIEYLFIDVLRAVLCVPAKLDALRK